MSTIGKRTIYVGPVDGSNSKPLHVEGVATEAGILPGAVLDYAAASAGLELMDDAATVFGKPLLVADKDQQRTRSVDTAWTVDENMVAIQPRSGEFVNVAFASLPEATLSNFLVQTTSLSELITVTLRSGLARSQPALAVTIRLCAL